mgnify:CR=1 FL=1
MPGQNEYRCRCLLRLAMAVLAIFGDTPADVHSEPLRQGWRINNYVDLSSNTLYHVNRSSSGTLHTIAAAGGLDLVNDFSPWQSGIFADQQTIVADRLRCRFGCLRTPARDSTALLGVAMTAW